MHEYYFSLDTDDDKGTPFGPVNKENLDISRLIVDMSCWLDPSESIIRLEHMMIYANPPSSVHHWQSDYPLNGCGYSSGGYTSDTYPLDFVRQSVIHGGKVAAIDVAAGTPGFVYAVSFTATAGVSLRRRLVDILMEIDIPLNPTMVALSDAPPPSFIYPLVVTASTTLPYGFYGKIYVENSTGAPITITLPPSPTTGQNLVIKDTLGNAGTHAITVMGNGYNIEGVPSLLMSRNYNWVQLDFTGAQWVQIS